MVELHALVHEVSAFIYILAYNLHSVQDTFIYYKRQTRGENLKFHN